MDNLKKLFTMRRATFPVVAALLVTVLAIMPGSPVSTAALGCPAGFHPKGFGENSMGAYSDVLNVETGAKPVCINDKHPEGLAEMAALAAQRAAIQGGAAPPPGAFSRALIARRRALALGQDPANDNAWEKVGIGPLQAGDDGYSSVNVLGLRELGGRITDFDYVAPTDSKYPDTLLASTSYGGIWIADSSASTWTSIGESLPTQIMGSVGYTPAGGGTILALSGDGSFGADSREGAGAYYTTDTGKTWHRAVGVPDDTFGFKLAVDKAHPSIVYAATGAGLYRSKDAGRTYVNVKLPTGDCAGKSNHVRACVLANIVSDVAVMAPGGTTREAGGKVIAAVGWRGGDRVNPDKTVQSPENGIFLSDDGTPGSFTKSPMTGFAPKSRIGRTELGAAYGPQQNHNVIYAMVQDAVYLRKGLPVIDAPDASGACATATKTIGAPVPVPCSPPTVFNGVYSSIDFGKTWILMADAAELESPATGSALAVVNPVLGSYGPGVQAWYNMWIAPDPTRALNGIPTRLTFGLEEVWESENTHAPQIGHSAFHVIGRYFSGSTCLFLQLLPVCPTNRDQALVNTTTTHPDQQDAIYIPNSDGVRIVVGNDGGVYTQQSGINANDDFSNANWGIGNNRGFNTLLPYDATRAKDGTVWMGLQDNGTAKITDIKRNGKVIERQRVIETKGGDGFFTAVDPNNSNVAYGEYVGGRIAATSDGGRTWNETSPPITHALFSTPFIMDPRNAKHLMVAGKEVVETVSGPGTSSGDWKKVFDLGTNSAPGDTKVAEGPSNPGNSMTAVDLVGANAYVGFCGPCDVLNQSVPFKNGIATNVSGKKAPKVGTSDGWHIARAIGLPNRYITWVAQDPQNPETVYAALGGYYRPWTLPNVYGPANQRAGKGHLYVSTDAGEHFIDVTGNLPDTPINSITLRGDQVLVATDVGVFISDPTISCDRPSGPSCTRFQVLGHGLPMSPIRSVRMSGGDPNVAIVAAYGRGAYLYRFGPSKPFSTPRPKPGPKFLNKIVAGPFGFETSAEGWTADGTTTKWRQLAPGDASSMSMQAAPYTDDSATALMSPKFALPASSTVQVSWSQRSDTEPCCDFITLFWSSDGKVWRTVRSSAGQNPDFPNFTTMSARFAAPKGSLYVKFGLASDSLVASPAYSGVAIDNVAVSR